MRWSIKLPVPLNAPSGSPSRLGRRREVGREKVNPRCWLPGATKVRPLGCLTPKGLRFAVEGFAQTRVSRPAGKYHVGGHGSVYTSDHRLWGTGDCGRWSSALSHVQSCHPRQGLPTRLSTDHDPLFQFHRWPANLRLLDVERVQTVPLVPWSHPFVEQLIGTLSAGSIWIVCSFGR